jgi:hypothetical protein
MDGGADHMNVEALSDFTLDRLAPPKGIADRSLEAFKRRKSKKSKKDKQPGKGVELEKAEAKYEIFVAAPPPAVNVWRQRAEAVKAKATTATIEISQKPNEDLSSSSNPVASILKAAGPKKKAKLAFGDLDRPTTLSHGSNAKEQAASIEAPKRGSEMNGRSKEESNGRRPAPRGSRKSDKEEKVTMKNLPPPVKDATSWPTPYTAVEEKRKVEEKVEKDDKDESNSNMPRPKEKWVTVPYIPTVTFNTPLPIRSGRGRGGSGRGGHGTNGSISGDKTLNSNSTSTHTSGEFRDRGRDNASMSRATSLTPNSSKSTGDGPYSSQDQRKPSTSTFEKPRTELDMVQQTVNATLDDMTLEKFDKIADQILAIVAHSKDKSNGHTLRQVTQLIFEKAIGEAHLASICAKLCKLMAETISPDIKDESDIDKNGNAISGGRLFRKYMLNRCQEQFECRWEMDLRDKPNGGQVEEKIEEAADTAKQRDLGLVKFLAELYKAGMLTERNIHQCVKMLVTYIEIPDEAGIEPLTMLLKTIGGNLDRSEKGRPMMDLYFACIQTVIDTPEFHSDLKFMLIDIVDLRKKHWRSKERGPVLYSPGNRATLSNDELLDSMDHHAWIQAQANFSGSKESREPKQVHVSPKGLAGANSSLGTLTDTYNGSTTRHSQSTLATSNSNVDQSMRTFSKRMMVENRIIEEPEPLYGMESVLQGADVNSVGDGQSTISADSVVLLTQKQKEDIINKFTEALVKDLPKICLVSHSSDMANLPFRQQFRDLLKQYSEEVKKDAARRSRRRQASKAIRNLKIEIITKCEETLGYFGTSAKEARVYPTIIQEAERINLPEKTYAEKVRDWSGLLPQVEFMGPYDDSPNFVPLDYDHEDQQSALSENSIDMSPSDVVSRSDVDFDIAEDKDVHHYLTNHAAFIELIAGVKKLVERHYCSQMELIGQCVLISIRRPGAIGKSAFGSHQVEFRVDWDVVAFLKEQYSLGLSQDLSHVVTITGQAVNAQLTTVCNFLKQTWPDHTFELLQAIQSTLSRHGQDSDLPSKLGNTPSSAIFIDLERQTVTATGSEDLIVTVAQQLTWLGAACRASVGELAYCYPTFDEAEISRTDFHVPAFQITYEVVPLSAQEPRSCWNKLVGSSVIATGFPISERLLNETGLDVPLEIMAALAGIPLATQYGGGYVLKGRSLMFVPVERRGNSVQWHLVQKHNGRILYKDLPSLCPVRLPLQELDEDALFSTKAFLGWCPKSINNLATSQFDYLAIGYSKMPLLSKKRVSLTSATIGFSHIGTGTANFTFGKKDGVYHAEKPQFYEDLLDDARQIHVILQDTRTRRAWHTNAEVVILHIILHRRELKLSKADRKTEFRTADAEIPSSVRVAMRANSNIVIMSGEHMDKRELKTKVFRDLVGELYTTIEGLKAYSEDVASGIELKLDWKRLIQGWEYMDLVDKKRDFRLKEAELKRSCGHWPDFARDINAVILFGTQFRDVIQPKDNTKLCRRFKEVPPEKHYLTVEVSTLCRLYLENGSSQDQERVTPTGMGWHRSKYLFESCPRTKSNSDAPCQCERIQEFVLRKGFSKIKPPGRLEKSGAAIFGQRDSSWTSELIKSWSNIRSPLDQQNNAEPPPPNSLCVPNPTFTTCEKDLSHSESRSSSEVNSKNSSVKTEITCVTTGLSSEMEATSFPKDSVNAIGHSQAISASNHGIPVKQTMALTPKLQNEAKVPATAAPLPKTPTHNQHISFPQLENLAPDFLSCTSTASLQRPAIRIVADPRQESLGGSYMLPRTFRTPQRLEAPMQMASRSIICPPQIDRRQMNSEVRNFSTNNPASTLASVHSKPVLRHKRNFKYISQVPPNVQQT